MSVIKQFLKKNSFFKEAFFEIESFNKIIFLMAFVCEYIFGREMGRDREKE